MSETHIKAMPALYIVTYEKTDGTRGEVCNDDGTMWVTSDKDEARKQAKEQNEIMWACGTVYRVAVLGMTYAHLTD